MKFDNYGEGRARFSFKIWLDKKELEEIPELYILVSNVENPVSLEMVFDGYTKYLVKGEFRKAAGIEDTAEEDVYDRFVIGDVLKFEEAEHLKKRRLLTPKSIIVEIVRSRELAREVTNHAISNNDILLKIQPIDKEIAGFIKDSKTNPIIEFQFRIFLRNFLTTETLRNWKSSSESWSVDIDIHKERGYEKIHRKLRDLLKYPRYLDVWVNIPHNHLFIASSPIYRNAIKLKIEDIQYKIHEEDKQYQTHETHRSEVELFKKFETKEGDYSVRISNSDGKPKDLSFICVSPFLPEEAPSKLRQDIVEFEKKSEELEKSQRNMLKELEGSQRDILRSIVGIFGVFIAIFSFVVISINTVLNIQIPVENFSFWDVLLRVSALLLPVFVFLSILLIIAVWTARK